MFSVLVIEDNDVIARLLARCVSENRWLDLAGVATTEQAAVSMARRARPDLVLLDFGLSAPMAGFELWHILQGLDEEPDVIAVTAAGDMSIVEKARKRGAFDYVVKPFTRATIQTKLADYTNFRRSVMAAPRRADQSVINGCFGWRHRSSSLPAGLLPETRDSIIAALRAAERPMRALEIAERAGVERGTANRYLTYLCDQRIADRVPEHGRPGHPAYLYTLSPIWETPPEDPA
ncbi:MAG: response regulator [Streptosporangiaceae bacterium]|nr:response regulator [Streptosporangiaceae bacterium]